MMKTLTDSLAHSLTGSLTHPLRRVSGKVGKWVSGMLMIGALVTLPACRTLENPDTLARVQTAAKIAAFVGSAEYLHAHPEHRAGFESARAELLEFEASDTVDFATLLAVVQRLPVKEIKSERAQMIITVATIAISDVGGALPVERLSDLKPVARSIREGIELALR
jgi:hypothetical protein